MRTRFFTNALLGLCLCRFFPVATPVALALPAEAPTAAILTPPAPKTPRINGPGIFGVRPGSPFLYTIPATGDRPMAFAADGLPVGLKVDGETGRITGVVDAAGEYPVVLRAKNSRGEDAKKFRIVVGDKIALTPPMGWNSWNCWARAVDQDKVLRSARAMVSSGLAQHGWTYINIDDTWQGKRDPATKALQPNAKFPDMKALCVEIHSLGLKAGIYSTPWITSYAKYAGGSADDPEGSWQAPPPGTKPNNKGIRPFVLGKYSFAKEDTRQWAEWGFDYLKYDWNPNLAPQVEAMSTALRATGRDIVYSLSNGAPFQGAADYARLANSWRTTGDIRDNWKSLSKIGFSQDKWALFAGPGHWNDPDMLVVGLVGWGPKLHPSNLTPNEQYTHISLWCMLSAPLLIGCDLEHLDAFTLSLLTNDEVLAIDQDPLGRQATRILTEESVDIYTKPLDDGGTAIGFFNRGTADVTVSVKCAELDLAETQAVRDLWRQQDLGVVAAKFETTVAPHGAVLIKATPAK
jgi:alpha-galactosidase